MSTAAVALRRPAVVHPWPALAAVLLSCACGGDGGERPIDPGRAKYEADRAHCESVSDIEAARKSCMSYRGWPDGKYRR